MKKILVCLSILGCLSLTGCNNDYSNKRLLVKQYCASYYDGTHPNYYCTGCEHYSHSGIYGLDIEHIDTVVVNYQNVSNSLHTHYVIYFWEH